LRSRLFGIGEPDPELARLLTSPAVETVHTTEASLDDVFVTVTGQRL
jgi:hypothetical protein